MLVGLVSFGQTDKEVEKDEKKINKCIKVFNKDFDKGIDKLSKYMDKQLEKRLAAFPSLTAYETLVKMEHLKYMRDKELFEGIEITVEGDDEELDSSMVALLESFKNFPFNYFMDVCRRATIESESFTADLYLRKYLVDYDPDSLVSDEALEFFEEAEKFFFDEDYELAELNYRKAIDADSTYYMAYLYLGDSFWAREDYDSAIVYYNKAKFMHPILLEPRKFIVDALIEQGLYYRAKKECLESFTVYPGFGMKLRLQKILYVEDKYMHSHRFIRYFYPNDMANDEQRSLRGIWGTYRKSKYKISKYCSDDGIIEENGETDDRYLEVYSIRRMLNENEDDLPRYMEFAQEMNEEGYLEPYVFISLFHIDIYPQFKDYMSVEENREKSIEFVEEYLIKKFD